MVKLPENKTKQNWQKYEIREFMRSIRLIEIANCKHNLNSNSFFIRTSRELLALLLTKILKNNNMQGEFLPPVSMNPVFFIDFSSQQNFIPFLSYLRLSLLRSLSYLVTYQLAC